MKQMTKIYFTVAWIVSMVYAILLSITIVGLIFGIPLFIAMSKFNKAREMTDEELVKNRGDLLGWGIFLAIMLSPTIIGLIIVLILVFMVNSYIKNIEEGNYEKTNKGFTETLQDGASNAWTSVKNTFKGKSELEKQQDQLKELQGMLEQGIITEEEYEAKRKQILGL